MFSGKSEEMLRRLRLAQIAGRSVVVYKPSLDTRTRSEVVTRAGLRVEAHAISRPNEMLSDPYHDVIGIDEAQFFDKEIVYAVKCLRDRNSRVVIAGLDMDYSGKPFGHMPELLAVSDFVDKLQAVCVRCGGPASVSYRLIDSDDTIVVGDSEYEARCRGCSEA